jgi:hypothetical protein
VKAIIRYIAAGFLILNMLIVSVGLTIYQSQCDSGCDTHISLTNYKDDCCETDEASPKEEVVETASCCHATATKSCDSEASSNSRNAVKEECCDFSLFSFYLEVKKPVDEDLKVTNDVIETPVFWVTNTVINKVEQPFSIVYPPPPPESGREILNKIQVYLI